MEAHLLKLSDLVYPDPPLVNTRNPSEDKKGVTIHDY